MPREFPRTRRVGEQIKRELAELIREESNTPLLNMTSITSVDITRDFAHAKVYVTLLGEADKRQQVVDRLNQLTPLFRRELGRSLRLRAIPNLTFIYDDIVEQGAKLSNLISQTVAADAARHQNSDPEENNE